VTVLHTSVGTAGVPEDGSSVEGDALVGSVFEPRFVATTPGTQTAGAAASPAENSAAAPPSGAGTRTSGCPG